MKKKNTMKIYTVVILVILLILIVPYFRRGVSSVISRVATSLEGEISRKAKSSKGIFSAIFEIRRIKNENDVLADKLTNCLVDQSKLNELSRENDILKKQLGFLAEHKDKDLITSQIIGREPTGYLDNVIIDKGERDGVKTGSAVVSDGALVGKVAEVSDTSAKVILITSKDSLIQAMLQKSRVLGILKGGLSGITLDNIPQDVESGNREAVVTSGLGGEMEKGILIGYVTGEESSLAEILKTLTVEPVVDFSKLEVVFVVK